MANFKKYVLQPIYRVIFKLAGIFLPTNRKLVVFESFHGKQFSDNPRAIYEYMKLNYPEYELLWSVDKKNKITFSKFDGINVIYRFSLKWLMKMNQAKYWVTNSRLPLWIPKPRSTEYIQTWHGTPLKKLALDMDEVYMPGTDTISYKKNFLQEARKWDYLVSPNHYSTKIFRRAFDFRKEMIEAGYPRNDILINKNNEENIINIKKDIRLPQDKKVILYAPTWRDDEFYSVGRYKFKLQIDIEKMKKELGDDYIVILRVHYLIADSIDLSIYSGFVYNLSNYPDIRDLYLISDILITDYSSVFFDYANLKRPIIFFVYDIDNYRDKLRGFYFDFEKKAPGPMVKTTEGIIREIKRLEKEGFRFIELQESFYEEFCKLEDGSATERVVKAFLNN